MYGHTSLYCAWLYCPSLQTLGLRHPVTSKLISIMFLPAFAYFASHFGHSHKILNFFSVTIFAVVICDPSVATNIKARPSTGKRSC